MKDTLRFSWPVLLTVVTFFEMVLIGGKHFTDIGMQSVIVVGMLVLFFMLHKIKNKI